MIGRGRGEDFEAAPGWALPRGLLLVVVLFVACLCSASRASAEVQPTLQARVANAEFLAYAPPPPKPAAVCLIDSGVDLNPDTAPLIAERISLDGGSGDDVLASKHGTQMAMVMGAPANGWGMVGIWPYLKIVSVRATPAGQEGFEFEAYRRRSEECRLRAARHGIAVAELALGGQRRPTAEEEDRFSNRCRTCSSSWPERGGCRREFGRRRWRRQPRSSQSSPWLRETPLDALCDIASRGPSIDLVAPGCGLDQALPSTGSPALGKVPARRRPSSRRSSQHFGRMRRS